MDFWFWTIFSGLTLTWYVVITLVVAYKGGGDIKRMIKRLGKR